MHTCKIWILLFLATFLGMHYGVYSNLHHHIVKYPIYLCVSELQMNAFTLFNNSRVILEEKTLRLEFKNFNILVQQIHRMPSV